MARGKTVGDAVAKSVGDAVAETVAEESGIMAVMTGLPTDAVIEVWRRDEQTKTYGFTGKRYAPDEFTIEQVEQDLGGGNFQMRIRFQDPSTGHRGYMKGSRLFAIEGEPRTVRVVGRGEDDAPMPGVNGMMPLVPGRAGEGGGGMIELAMMTLLKQMQDNATANLEAQRSQNQMMLEFVKGMRGNGPDPLVLELIRAMAGRPDPMAELGKFAELLRNNQTPAAQNTFREVLETMKLMKENADIFGGGASEDPTMAMVGRGLDVLGKIVEQQATQPRPVVPAPKPAAAVAPGKVPAVDTSVAGTIAPAPARTLQLVGDTEMRMWKGRVKPMLGAVKNFSQMMSPHTAASWVLDQASEDEDADIRADVQDTTPPGFVERAMADFKPDADVSDFIRETLEELEGFVHDDIEGEADARTEHDGVAGDGRVGDIRDSGAGDPGESGSGGGGGSTD